MLYPFDFCRKHEIQMESSGPGACSAIPFTEDQVTVSSCQQAIQPLAIEESTDKETTTTTF